MQGTFLVLPFTFFFIFSIVPQQKTPNSKQEANSVVLFADMCPPLHSFPLVSGHTHALQEDRGLPDMQQNEERLSDMPPGSGVWYELSLLMNVIVIVGQRWWNSKLT